MRSATLWRITSDAPDPYDKSARTLYGRPLTATSAVHILDGLGILQAPPSYFGWWIGGDLIASIQDTTDAACLASLEEMTGIDCTAIVRGGP